MKTLKKIFAFMWILSFVLFITYICLTSFGDVQENIDNSLAFAEWTINF